MISVFTRSLSIKIREISLNQKTGRSPTKKPPLFSSPHINLPVKMRSLPLLISLTLRRLDIETLFSGLSSKHHLHRRPRPSHAPTDPPTSPPAPGLKRRVQLMGREVLSKRSRPKRADAQRLVTTRLLDHLHDPLAATRSSAEDPSPRALK